jgi:hypothetical protein
MTHVTGTEDFVSLDEELRCAGCEAGSRRGVGLATGALMLQGQPQITDAHVNAPIKPRANVSQGGPMRTDRTGIPHRRDWPRPRPAFLPPSRPFC